MKAISLHEPYASLIMWGWKTIETRTHQKFKGLLRETILIHATQNKHFLNSEIISEIIQYLSPEKEKEFLEYLHSSYFETTFGRLLGTVNVFHFGKLTGIHSQKAMIDCSHTLRYGLHLKNPRVLKAPISWKGHQGIFVVPTFDLKMEFVK